MAARGLLSRLGAIPDTDDCVLVSPTARGGYGKIKFMGKTLLSHRVSYELFNGPVPAGMMVCHKCDTTNCINPRHLFLGTAQDNMTDKIEKGRHKGARAGEQHHKARLSVWQVEEIRVRLEQGVSQRRLAQIYGVSQSAISNINTGKRWATNGKRY